MTASSAAGILAILAIAAGAAVVASCKDPTQITLVISTDVKCSEFRGSSVTVGRLGEIESKPPTTSSTFCDASGNLGTLVIVPSGDDTDEVAMKLVAGFGKDADQCAPPYGKGCIVARRAIRYVPHSALRIAIPLRAACDGVPCGESETCLTGACVPATIADVGACQSSEGCGEGALRPAVAPQPATAPVYHDMADRSFWSTFNMLTVNPGAKGYQGMTFDGRYVYFAPYYNGDGAAPRSGLVMRYDTQAQFASGASWSTFDATTVHPGSRGFAGAAFDGRHVYFAPLESGNGNDGFVTRYDTQAPFGTGASWSTFDAKTVDARGKGFDGATFDGRYVYFVPTAVAAVVMRYDTQASFGAIASWSMFDPASLSADAQGFQGAVFDGRHVYFVPRGASRITGLVMRYDTQATTPFTTAASWSTFDMTTLNAAAKGYFGGAFDGRYVYFVPWNNGRDFHSLVVRYDPQAPFGTSASWSIFDVSTVNASAKGFAGAAFDGRFVYLVPNQSSTPDGLVARYDTQAAFGVAGSWSTFDMTTAGADATLGFLGAAFDGRYVYLNSGGGVARFDVKTPPSLPKLPGFSGSFF